MSPRQGAGYAAHGGAACTSTDARQRVGAPVEAAPKGGAALRRHALHPPGAHHAAAVAGDTLIALALANSLFFDIDPNAARGKVTLYLALTMAPFAVVAPLDIGLALDRARGGRRFMVIGANALRAVICVLMIRDIDGLLLFPEAFAVVLAKSYHVAKSAIVPTVVSSDAELVEANSPVVPVRRHHLRGRGAGRPRLPDRRQPGRAGAGGRRVHGGGGAGAGAGHPGGGR